eukprot:2510430-Rhodomonas_salina.2
MNAVIAALPQKSFWRTSLLKTTQMLEYRVLEKVNTVSNEVSRCFSGLRARLDFWIESQG